MIGVEVDILLPLNYPKYMPMNCVAESTVCTTCSTTVISIKKIC